MEPHWKSATPTSSRARNGLRYLKGVINILRLCLTSPLQLWASPECTSAAAPTSDSECCAPCSVGSPTTHNSLNKLVELKNRIARGLNLGPRVMTRTMDDKVPAACTSEAIRDQEPLIAAQPTGSDDFGGSRQEEDHQNYEFESPSRPWWKGYANLYISICYILVIWCAILLQMTTYTLLVHVAPVCARWCGCVHRCAEALVQQYLLLSCLASSFFCSTASIMYSRSCFVLRPRPTLPTPPKQ